MEIINFRVMWRNKNFNGWCCDTELRKSYKQAESLAKSMFNDYEGIIEVAVEKTVSKKTIEFNLKK